MQSIINISQPQMGKTTHTLREREMITVEKPLKTNSFVVEYMNKIYRFEERRTLIVAPVRWGKTTLLATIARELTHNYNTLCIFISPNLRNLQEDWIDKHTWLNHQDGLDFECLTMRDGGINSMFGDMLVPERVSRIYSTHKHTRWMHDLETSLTQIKQFSSKVDKQIVFLVDEIHGVERENHTNAHLMKCIEMMSHIGWVIAATATPNRNLGSDFWEDHISIDYPQDVTPPHKTELLPITETDVQTMKDQHSIPPRVLKHLKWQMKQNPWNIIPVVGQIPVAFHKWMIRELRRHFPQSVQLRISEGKYILYHRGVGSKLDELLNNDKTKKISSVQQAITAVTDHLFKDQRATLDLFVVGHNQIEEGQTHGNFTGDRFPTAELIIPPQSPWDDKFAQWNRIEQQKAQKFGIVPRIITDKDCWEDNHAMIEHVQRHAQALSDGTPFEELHPSSTRLKSSAIDAGRYREIPCPTWKAKADRAPLISQLYSWSIKEIDKLIDDPTWLDGFVYHRELDYTKRNSKLYSVIRPMIQPDHPNNPLRARVVQGTPLTKATQTDGTPAGNDVSIYIYCTPGSVVHRERDMIVWRNQNQIHARVWKRDVEWDETVGAKQHVWDSNIKFIPVSKNKPTTVYRPISAA